MLINNILKLSHKTSILLPQLILKHTATCPTNKYVPPSNPYPACKGFGKKKGDSSTQMKRSMYGAKVRYGFIPEEWFLFFHSKTGVSGPYIFGIGLANYLLSKEIYVLEHEYYLGCSIFIMVYLAATKLGPGLGRSLDKEVDAYCAMWEKGRIDEIKAWENYIKDAKDAQRRAEGQKILMDAKKENITMQIEAIYRERLMALYKSVKSRLDYQVKLHQAEVRIHQKWMLGWILEQVMKSITPELQDKVLQKAIEDIGSIASPVG